MHNFAGDESSSGETDILPWLGGIGVQRHSWGDIMHPKSDARRSMAHAPNDEELIVTRCQLRGQGECSLTQTAIVASTERHLLIWACQGVHDRDRQVLSPYES